MGSDEPTRVSQAPSAVQATGNGNVVVPGTLSHSPITIHQGGPALAPATPCALHQLPSPLADFTGRGWELEQLEQVLGGDGGVAGRVSSSHLPLGIALFDDTLALLAANHLYCRILEYPEELAVPGTPEVREYQAYGVLSDAQIGQPSDIVTVTFGG